MRIIQTQGRSQVEVPHLTPHHYILVSVDIFVRLRFDQGVLPDLRLKPDLQISVEAEGLLALLRVFELNRLLSSSSHSDR